MCGMLEDAQAETMHEMSIAASVLDAVRAESRRRGECRPIGVGLRVGELAGVDPESLRFCWEVLVADTELGRLPLSIEFRPWTNRCRRCGHTFRVEDYNVKCPACGSVETEPAGGAELELAWLEVDELVVGKDEPDSPGTQSSE